MVKTTAQIINRPSFHHQWVVKTIKNWDGLLIINHINEIDKYEYTTDK